MNKRIILSEEEKNRILGLHLAKAKEEKIIEEAYTGIVGPNDNDICVVTCKQKVMTVGSRGFLVRMIQQIIYILAIDLEIDISTNSRDNKEKVLDGLFGVGCRRDFQKCNGEYTQTLASIIRQIQIFLKLRGIDGIVGNETLSAICRELKNGPLGGPTSKIIDYDLCKACKCEGGKDTSEDEENPLNDVDCDSLKDCVYKYLLTPAPDMKGFYGCIKKGGGNDEIIRRKKRKYPKPPIHYGD